MVPKPTGYAAEWTRQPGVEPVCGIRRPTRPEDGLAHRRARRPSKAEARRLLSLPPMGEHASQSTVARGDRGMGGREKKLVVDEDLVVEQLVVGHEKLIQDR